MVKILDDKKYWLGLIKLQGLGPRIIKNLLDYFGDAKTIWEAGRKELCRVNQVGGKRSKQIVRDRESIDLDYEVQVLKDTGIKYLTLTDKEYPFLLKNIHDPPPVLFYKGSIEPDDTISLAVVGSRKCTNYGRTIAKRLSAALAEKGFTVISGLARGIDTCSHQGALSKGRTIAVLGSGLDVVYPPENDNLMKEIINNGAVISSFPLATAPNRENFPQRNRIISGLTLGTIVVEAAQKSGSLITANFALEQGREVFAIPGDITKEQSFGTNQLIQNGAKLVQNIDDILTELPLEDWLKGINREEQTIKSEEKAIESREKKSDLSSEEAEVYNQLSSEPQEFNEVLQAIDLSPGKLNSILLKLELKGIVTQLSGNRFTHNC